MIHGLRKHLGTHVETFKKVVESKEFHHVNFPLKQLSQDIRKILSSIYAKLAATNQLPSLRHKSRP